MASKKAKMEIKQILDIEDPMSKTILALGLLNVFMFFVTTHLSTMNMETVFAMLIHLMFALYMLSCFRNGNCNIFAFVLSILLISTLMVEVLLRIMTLG